MRLASLAPSATEIIYALGQGSNLAAVTAFCNYPPEAKSLPRLPGWSTLTAEQVLTFRPDIAFTSSICQERLRSELQAAGVRLLHSDPRSLDGVAHSFIETAEALGIQAEGRALARAFHAALDPYKAAAPARRPRVYVEEWNKPPMAAGNWVPEMVLAAGGEPFNRGLGELSKEVTWEELMEFDPEIVIYSICGLGKAFDAGQFMTIEGWNTLSAAKSGRIHSVDDAYFNIPGPRLIEGVKLLKELIQSPE